MQRIYINDVKTFNHDLLGDIGVYTDSDNVNWFSLNDIKRILNLGSNIIKFMNVAYVDGKDYKQYKVFVAENRYVLSKFVSVSMLYRFLLEGDSDICLSFKRWLSEVILPSLNVIDDFDVSVMNNFISSEMNAIQAAYDLNKPDKLKQSLDDISNAILTMGVNNSKIDPEIIQWKKNEDQKELNKKKAVCPDWIKELVRK